MPTGRNGSPTLVALHSPSKSQSTVAFFVASQAGYAKNLRTYPSGACSSYLWGKVLASLGFHALFYLFV